MFARIKSAVEAQGLLIRAAFHVEAADQVPALEHSNSYGIPSGSLAVIPAGTLILIGNAGSSMWPVFSRSAEYLDAQPDALDRWSLRLGNGLAEQFSGMALFPFGGTPYHPFLRWAKRGDASVTSPLGLSLHPQYGLWHAYRFGLVLRERLEGLPVLPDNVANSVATSVSNPYANSVSTSEPFDACQRCEAKPCLSACPVSAFSGPGNGSGGSYQPGRCASFLARTPAYSCNQLGCASRRACPQGGSYQYQPEHAQFHMRVFVALHAVDHY